MSMIGQDGEVNVCIYTTNQSVLAATWHSCTTGVLNCYQPSPTISHLYLVIHLLSCCKNVNKVSPSNSFMTSFIPIEVSHKGTFQAICVVHWAKRIHQGFH